MRRQGGEHLAEDGHRVEVEGDDPGEPGEEHDGAGEEDRLDESGADGGAG